MKKKELKRKLKEAQEMNLLLSERCVDLRNDVRILLSGSTIDKGLVIMKHKFNDEMEKSIWFGDPEARGNGFVEAVF